MESSTLKGLKIQNFIKCVKRIVLRLVIYMTVREITVKKIVMN